MLFIGLTAIVGIQANESEKKNQSQSISTYIASLTSVKNGRYNGKFGERIRTAR